MTHGSALSLSQEANNFFDECPVWEMNLSGLRIFDPALLPDRGAVPRRADAVFGIGRANIVIAEAAKERGLSSYHRYRPMQEETTARHDDNTDRPAVDAAVHPIPGTA